MFRLPVPTRYALDGLSPLHLGALEILKRMREIHRGGAELLERITHQEPERALATVRDLAARHLILHHEHADGTHSLAVRSLVRTLLEAEKKRNRMNRLRNLPLRWNVARSVKSHFPAHCAGSCADDEQAKPKRAYKDGYMIPAAFKPLLSKFPHSHIKARPATAEIVAGPYMPPDFPMLMRYLEEKLGMGFRLHLLYTRKSISVARIY